MSLKKKWYIDKTSWKMTCRSEWLVGQSLSDKECVKKWRLDDILKKNKLVYFILKYKVSRLKLSSFLRIDVHFKKNFYLSVVQKLRWSLITLINWMYRIWKYGWNVCNKHHLNASFAGYLNCNRFYYPRA